MPSLKHRITRWLGISQRDAILAQLQSIEGQLTRQSDTLARHQLHLSQLSLSVSLDQVHDRILERPRYADPRHLARFQGQLYSQNQEDGMLAEMFRRLGIAKGTFVEMGLEDGHQCNTRLLLECGWTGIWVEGSPEHCATIRRTFAPEIAAGRLTLIEALITPGNALGLLRDAGLPERLDFLSVDIDMHTHHVWETLASLRPAVCCIEYNGSVPPSIEWSVPYVAGEMWDGSNRVGAGLAVLHRIARSQGQTLVACDLCGVNAFFVRDDLVADRFVGPFSAEGCWEPTRLHLVHHRGFPAFRRR